MKERGFIISDSEKRYSIKGGSLWKAPHRDDENRSSIFLEDKKLSIGLHPGDSIEGLISDLRDVLKKESASLYFQLVIDTLMAPLVLLAPAIMLIAFIAIIGAYGNLVNEIINLGEGPTTLGITKWQLFWIETISFILGAYAFPLFFEGDYSDTIQKFKGITDSSTVKKGRVQRAVKALKRGKFANRVEIWNPNFLSQDNQWVIDSLLPGIIGARIPLNLQVKVEEKFVGRRIMNELMKDELEWTETAVETEQEAGHAISQDYLEEWEKDMIPVLASASTSHLPDDWKFSLDEGGSEAEEALAHTVSIDLAKMVVGQFRNRLFSESYSENDVSVDLFVSRCINDYGILFPLSYQTQLMWRAPISLLEPEIIKIKEERTYIHAWFEANTAQLFDEIRDPAAALILAGTHKNSPVFNENKLRSIEGFIRIIVDTEQYKALRRYWGLMTVLQLPDREENLEEELYRLIDTQVLEKLVLAFRRSGMYDKTGLCYDYLRSIYPITSGIGEGIVLAEQGKYYEAIDQLITIDKDWMGCKLSDGVESQAGANSNLPPVSKQVKFRFYVALVVIIVMNQLRDKKELAERIFDVMAALLESMGEGERENFHLCRYYNVLASYYEWEGAYQKGLETYHKGLQIPGVEMSLISSLLVNIGIIYRLLGKSKATADEAIPDLKEAIRFNFEGVEAKDILGNEDQLPIALHNLAESCIELGYRLSSKDEKTTTYTDAFNYAQKGLRINESIGSVKKEGQLLAERFVASYALRKMNATVPHADTDPADALKEWILKKIGQEGYDIDVVLGLLKLTDDFHGDTLEEASKWINGRVLTD